MALCDTGPMKETDMTELRAAVTRINQAEAAVRQARLDLGRVIGTLRARGVKQTDIADTLGYTREQVRRLERDAETSLSESV